MSASSGAGSEAGLEFIPANMDGKPVVPILGEASAHSSAGDDDEYEVEHIRRHRTNDFSGEKEYLIKWKGYPESENTWEPDGNIVARSLIDDYNKKRKEAKKALQKEKRDRDRERQQQTDRDERKPSSSLNAPNASKKEKEMNKKHGQSGSGKAKDKTIGTSKVVALPLATKTAPVTGFEEVGVDNMSKQGLGFQPSGVGSSGSVSVSVQAAAAVKAVPVVPIKNKSTGLKDVGLSEMFKQTAITKINGFEKGYTVERIIGVARKDSGEGFNFLVKWKPQDLMDDDEEVELLDSDLVKDKDTMAVLLYYESLVRVSASEDRCDTEDEDSS